MAEKRNIEYDSDAVFISYSPEDIDWAEDELRPRLEKSGVKVITSENLTTGATKSLNLEQVIADTRRTIVVLSPEWVANSWNGFEADMLVHLDPAAIKRKLLPVLLRKTEIPPRIARLTIRELTDKKRYESRLAQLIRDVEDSVPPPPRENFPNPWEWYWRQARRRGATPGRVAAVAIGLLLVLLATLQIWPFQPRNVWLVQDSMPGLTVMHNTGAGLVAGARQDKDNCPTGDVFRGLAYRSLAANGRWQPSRVPDDLLCVRSLNKMTNIIDFASHPEAPSVVYVLTVQKGIIISQNGGESYQLLSPVNDSLTGGNEPHLLAVGGAAEAPTLWVAGKQGGLWRVTKSEWQSVGDSSLCPLPNRAVIDSLLVDGSRLLAGSVRQGLWLVEGERCTRVDTPGVDDRWEYYQLAVAGTDQNRYLAVVRDRETSPQYQLVVICPLVNDCVTPPWPLGQSLWKSDSPMVSLTTRVVPGQDVVWAAADQSGHVVQGDLNGITRHYPRVSRCLPICAMALSWLAGDDLYLLANPYQILAQRVTDGHFYTYARGVWYRRIWP